MSKPPQGPPHPLFKQQSWSPDIQRDEAWQRRKGNHAVRSRHNRTKSLWEDDLEELKACIELGFGFESGSDSPEIDPKLADTIPALEFYHAVNKQYSQSLSRSSSSSSLVSDCDSGSLSTIFDTGDDSDLKKKRLKQWAQVVAFSVRESSSSSYQADHIN
ncbi:Protein of unknown function (DUF1685) [Quillaja saponaria]|uniref:Uncharacterized protein n=1 Tax=Quillaja saponaria TaxID=32244 RepID=A0AAD7M047_QUISA|nr:Protein of unknown function (DUF1685) [Quillaja saponaria]